VKRGKAGEIESQTEERRFGENRNGRNRERASEKRSEEDEERKTKLEAKSERKLCRQRSRGSVAGECFWGTVLSLFN